MKNISRLIPIMILSMIIFLPFFLFAQENEVDMADTMRSNGKIYVVVSVVSIILLGLLIALINIDRRVKRMENEKKKD